MLPMFCTTALLSRSPILGGVVSITYARYFTNTSIILVTCSVKKFAHHRQTELAPPAVPIRCTAFAVALDSPLPLASSGASTKSGWHNAPITVSIFPCTWTGTWDDITYISMWKCCYTPHLRELVCPAAGICT